jgi:hypothetical protein
MLLLNLTTVTWRTLRAKNSLNLCPSRAQGENELSFGELLTSNANESFDRHASPETFHRCLTPKFRILRLLQTNRVSNEAPAGIELGWGMSQLLITFTFDSTDTS